MDIACEIRGLEKSFGANHVLRGIDLTLPKGQTTVLMGANGAGKSTLVKVLCGVHRADSGSVHLNARPYHASTPSDAIRAGVVTVHQSINDGVIPDLDVASNLMLDRLAEPGGFWARDRHLRRKAAEVARNMDLEIDITAPVRDLSLADRQLIAIARAMARKPSVLVLDEPTSSLSASEAERLFALLDRLRATGVAILYISHRMSDIRRIADRIVAMRDGQISGLFESQPLDLAGAVTAMLGHAMTDVDLTINEGTGEAVLELDTLALTPQSTPFSLTAHQGEVIAITGLVGSGKTDLAAALFGQKPPASGQMRLNQQPYAPRSAQQAIGRGVFLCPKDRRDNGVIPDFDLTRNLTLPFLSHHARSGFMRRASETRAMEGMINRLGIVCQGPQDGVLSLSGGNQQKVMVGRWLSRPCRLLVLDEPFQGVDIRARRDIGAHLRATAAERATIVFVAELDEALEIADRIVVMGDHTIRSTHVNRDVDLEAIVAQVTGTAPSQITQAPKL